MSKKVSLEQVRSAIGRNQRVMGTLKALGLGRIGNKKEIALSASVEGMISSVKHLLKVKEV